MSVTVDEATIPNTPSSSSTPLCGTCKAQPSKYTCPRCSFKSCCAACSTSHKLQYSCSGIRDPVAFVPMNKYGWGSMMNDYTYLEQVGRQISEWGVDLGKMRAKDGRKRGRKTARGRGRGRAVGGPGRAAVESEDSESGDSDEDGEDDAPGVFDGNSNVAPNGLSVAYGHGLAPAHSKLELLQRNLAARDIKMDILPEGMEKRKQNKSFWDVRTKSAMLSVEFVLHAPKRGIATSSDPNEAKDRIWKALVHRNALNQPLSSLLSKHLSPNASMKRPDIPTWTGDLLPSDGESPELVYLFSSSGRKQPHSFDPTKPLDALLRKKRFVEFPTIHVWLADEYEGNTASQPEDDDWPPPKKRKLNTKQAKTVLTGLIGGYGSDEEIVDALQGVARYSSGSDSGDQAANPTAGQRLDDEESLPDESGEGEPDWEDAEDEIQQDERLLMYLRNGAALSDLAPNGI